MTKPGWITDIQVANILKTVNNYEHQMHTGVTYVEDDLCYGKPDKRISCFCAEDNISSPNSMHVYFGTFNVKNGYWTVTKYENNHVVYDTVTPPRKINVYIPRKKNT